jgi:GT2 family glycosyltransferase
MTDVAVAIVSYNTREHLRACLESVAPERPVETVVVDNGSTDGSVEMVRDEFPAVGLIQSANRGYGAGANRAFAATTAPYVLLLNTDTVMQPGALAALAHYLDGHARAGVVGPRLLNPDGSLQPSCFPFPSPLNVLLVSACVGRAVCEPVPALRERFLRTWSHNAPRVVPWVRGAALGIRRDAFDEVGRFDEGFFLYYEETDLCRRLGRAGWETHFAPVTDVVHACEISTGGVGVSTATTRIYFQSLARYFKQHHSPLTRWTALFLERLVLLIRLGHGASRYMTSSSRGDRALVATEIQAWMAVLTTRWRTPAAS